MKDCQAGCKYFSGGEVKHHKDCVHYPESFSKMYDDIYQQNKEKDGTFFKNETWVNPEKSKYPTHSIVHETQERQARIQNELK